MCAHREGAYPTGTWRSSGNLPVSERLQDHGVMLPLYRGMTGAEQDEVVEALDVACRSAGSSPSGARGVAEA
jgi:dTDP-4-amino-4,6-dideoxygalactose transaminase